MVVQSRKRLVLKRAKPRATIQKSFLFQAEKVLAKTIKVLKVFFLRKAIRDAGESKSADNSYIEKLKKLSHTEVAKSIAEKNFPDCLAAVSVASINRSDDSASSGDDESRSVIGSALGDNQLEARFAQHKKVAELLAALKTKYEEMIAKNNALRAAEQRQQDRAKNHQAEATGAKKKNLLAKRAIDRNEVAKGMFCDSLEDDAKEEEEKKLDKQAERRRKHRESGRPSSNVRPPSRVRKERKAQKEFKEGDALPVDMSIYLPVEQRSVDTPKTTAEYMNRLMTQGKKGSGSGGDQRGYSERKMIKTAPIATAVATVAPVKEIVASGKDWKQTGVHPSWAAKQLAKKTATISIPAVGPDGTKKYNGLSFAKQPTKIVFADDD